MRKPLVESGHNHFDKMSKLIDINKKIEVYKNLHNKCWSVRQSGRVVCHTNYMTLRDCEFIVQASGRRRVLREKKKNVHAFVRGYYCSPRASDYTPPFSWECVVYNPYVYNSFFIPDINNKLINKAKFVDMDMQDKYAPLIAYEPISRDGVRT